MTTTNPTATAAPPTCAARILSNGRYAVLLTPGGGGMSALDGYALTRWEPDAVRDGDGTFLYLRDLDGGGWWAATPRPVYAAAGAVEVACDGRRAVFERATDEIATRLDIAVDADRNVEIRRLTLRNTGSRTRRLELTGYASLVLNTPAADAAHPAFSRLFVQTAYDETRRALVAWRRLRSPGDRPLWFGARLVGGAGATVSSAPAGARSLGRGRRAAAPRALTGTAPLEGTTGSVLDPVFALRRTLSLRPGEQAEVALVCAAADERAELERVLDDVGTAADVDGVLARAAATGQDALAALGLPRPWLRTIAFDAAWAHRAGDEDGAGHAFADGVAAAHPVAGSGAPAAAGLRDFNGYGGFTADGSEYVIRVPCDAAGAHLPPLPWVNVLANEQVGCVVSERGAVHTWAANSRENRLTPWSNDPVTDPHGEAFWVRDDVTGALHSLAPGPTPAQGRYDVHHGFGWSSFRFDGEPLAHELTVFVPREEPVRIVRVAVTNRSAAPRRVSVYGYAQLVLGGEAAATRGTVDVASDDATGALLARNPERGEFAARVAFAAAVSDGAAHHHTADRAAFLGAAGDIAHPAALATPALDGRAGAGLDPCAALQVMLRIEPGETAVCAFLLGEAEEAGAARSVLHRFADVAAVDEALADVRAFWADLVGAVRIESPAPELDRMVNGWLAYQNLACRMWGRTAFYQSGGAFGFRDQLQDASALLYLDPAYTRRQILLHAAHQFVEGDVLHWWHPPLAKGIRTRFADDLLWLPYITAFYVGSTGDHALLDEPVRFLTAPPLGPDEDEVFLVPTDAGTEASVFEHCCRSIDRSLTRGAHGLPLIGVGDWNDGMNRVGREGRGESVWLGFFLYDILHAFIPLCEQRGEQDRAERYRAYHRSLEVALNDGGWDGEWYRRAYYDNGAPLGAAASDECRIDTIAQAWAVLSGAAPAERARSALDAMEHHLVAEEDGLIRLLTPPFDRTPHDPGYIKGYVPGVRENGGQYTHGALWGVRALAEAGRSERAARLLAMLSPVHHTRTPQQVAVYQTEPYVIAADVYGVAPHVGRGGWTWYTGSAGWMFRVALESVLGLTLHAGTEIRLQPCVPADWPGYRIRYRLRDGTAYDIEVFNQDVGRDGVLAQKRNGDAPHDAGTRATGTRTVATLDDTPLTVRERTVVIPLLHDGRTHAVHVRLGSDVGPRYAPRPA